MKNLFVIAVVLISGSRAFAEQDLNPNIFNPPAKPPANNGTTATRDGSGTGNNNTAGVPKMNSTINPGSQQGQQSQSGGSGTNAAVGAALMAAGAMMMSQPPTVPPGAMLMAMGILAMMQSGEDSGAAGQSAATGAASNVNGTSAGTNTAATDGTGTSGFTEAKIKEGQAKLAEAGYKMTAKGLTTPDGKFIDSKSIGSPASMAASGMSPQAIADAQKLIADAEAGASGARVSGVALNTGGGGAGGAVGEGESSGSSESSLGNSNPFNMDADQKASLVAGKTVMFDGEPIGVRGQNIFDMVHACYQKKRDGKHFIEGEHDVVTRMPASVPSTKKSKR